jgi:hypothetical protein
MPPATPPIRPNIRKSVHSCGQEEAQQFKWIESEKAGRDLGEGAIRRWVCEHWNGFLRARWIEHLQGRTYWIELDQNDYGLLQRAFQGSSLIDPILDLLKFGSENLNILCQARDKTWPMAEVLEILEVLNINSWRLECSFSPR